jgi:hypothetical protein
MTYRTVAEVVNWLMLAVGAALFLGTGAALVTYRRTGAFPGQPEGKAASVGAAVAKCVVGALLMLWGAAGVSFLR